MQIPLIRGTDLKDLVKEDSFFTEEDLTDPEVLLTYNRDKAMKYVVLTDNEYANTAIVDALDKLRKLIQNGVPDTYKDCIHIEEL